MWETIWGTIQNICTGIVGVEVFIVVWAIVSIFVDEYREKKRNSNKISTCTRECHIVHDGIMCIHDDDWYGSCLDCPVKISYDDKQEAEKLEQVIKNAVEEVLEGK